MSETAKTQAHEGNCPEGTWHLRDSGDIYAVHPDGTTHILDAR